MHPGASWILSLAGRPACSAASVPSIGAPYFPYIRALTGPPFTHSLNSPKVKQGHHTSDVVLKITLSAYEGEGRWNAESR